jgi:hypothetical protein
MFTQHQSEVNITDFRPQLQKFDETIKIRLLEKSWILEICPQLADATYIILRLSIDDRGEKSFEVAMWCQNPAVRAKEVKLSGMKVQLGMSEEGEPDATTVVTILHLTHGLKLLVQTQTIFTKGPGEPFGRLTWYATGKTRG